MIKFFRKIRQKLIFENKFSKYLMYAIGEILLVVIGILIALQVNNWNTNRVERQNELKYLNRLKYDLKADTLYFKKRLERTQKQIKNHYDYVHQIYKEQKTVEEFIEVIRLLSWDSEHLVIQDNTYTELLSSGLLNIISNDKLKERLISLYKDYEVAATHIKEINEFTTKGFSKSVHVGTKYINPDMYDEPYMFVEQEWKFINDPLSPQFKIIENVATIYNYKYGHFVRYFGDLLSKSKEMVTQIEKEIDTLQN